LERLDLKEKILSQGRRFYPAITVIKGSESLKS
jgi:hypothetical protein